tara:strand:- start:15 stop:269 length:255 start_codon:yes stop_codon:yes gene_type:complete
MDYARAIKAINENAQFNIVEDDLDNIEWLNGTTPISKTDIEAKMSELPTAEEEVTSKENNKASGKQKLKDLGLNDDEIKALMGV